MLFLYINIKIANLEIRICVNLLAEDVVKILRSIS